MDFVLEDVMLPDKPIMLRWRQSENSPTDMKTSPTSSAIGGMGSFKVSLPKAATSLKTKKSPVEAKFVNFTASRPHQKKTAQKSKAKGKPAASAKKSQNSKTQDNEVQRRVVRTPLDVLEPSKDKGLVARYPSPLDRYFFNATPFPFTSLATLNTGHYTNYCKLLVLDTYSKEILTRLDLHGIANMMYPLSENLAFNPIRDRWFEVILQDETWFFTIIYVAARQLEAEHGANQSSQQVSRLMNHVLGRIKDSVERARQGHAPPDSVIGAVSCLVSLEVCLSCFTSLTAYYHFVNAVRWE